MKSTAIPPGITLLEASAGTGKTFRIAHSVLRLVAEEGVRIDRLVVVTFTEAATSELRERVRKRLRDGLLGLRARAAGDAPACPDEVLEEWVATASAAEVGAWAARLRAALVAFDDALICTIHGFCRRMLRRNAFESGAPFGADVVAGVPDLLDDLAVDFWTRLVYAADPSLLTAIKAAGITVRKLKKLAEKAADEDLILVPARPPSGATTGPLPDPTPWLRALEALRVAWDVNRVCRLFADPGVTVQRRKGGYESFPAGKTKSCAFAINDRLWGRRAVTPSDYLPDAFDYFAPGRIARATLPGKTAPSSGAITALAAFVAEHRRIRPAIAAVLQGAKHALVDEVRRELPRRARAANLCTYHDLLVDMRDGLRRGGGATSPLAVAVRRQYDVALIDEFQDTDPIQWEIFKTLFSERLRLIGDPKQAVYSFRGADVYTYEQAKRTANDTDSLGRNFRTDAPLLRAVGRLFARDQPFGEDTTKYPEVTAEHPASRLVGDDRPPLLFRFLPRKGAALRYGYLAKGPLREQVVRLVARDVSAELGRGTRIEEDGDRRTLSAGDCAILVRSNAEAGMVQAALRERGIPSVIKSTESVFKSPEASDLGTILQAVLEPTDTATVRRALTTSLMGRTATDLLAMEADPDRFDAEVSPFHVWRTAWLEDGIAPMLRRLLDDDGMTPRLLAQAGGARAVTNLEHLGELLTRATRERSLGPAGLLSWLRRGGSGTDDEDAAQRLESDDDAAQIVTMHSAKGLEWPLVWCPFLYYSNAWQSLDKDHLVFHDPDDDYRAKLDIGSPDRQAHKEQRKRELFQEDLRLAYVALTRARHRCVVYWGACDRDAAVGYLLHGVRLDKWKFGAAKKAMEEDAQMITDLRALGPADEIGVEVVAWSAPAPSVPRTAGPVPTFEVGRITRTRAPDDWWRRSSFTGLTRGGLDVRDYDDTPEETEDEDAPTDAGPGTDAPPPEAPALASELVTLAEFEAGRRAGNFMHKVFELHDFQRPDDLRALVEQQLAAHGIDVAHADLAIAGIQQTLETPLTGAGDLRLADLSRARRLDEMEFTLPSHGGFDPTGDVLTAKALREAFAGGGGPGLPEGWADRVGRLTFLPLRGFLTGAIDLVFEHDGRYYLADYKSNRLGRTYADYARPRLPAAMAHSHYVLQYHLYSLALHRYLASRISGYAFETHFGGVYYLFLRGMHPDLGASHGVFFDRPTEALVERLSRAVCGGAS